MIDPIVLGVVSGVLSAAIVYLLVSIFKNIVIPWYLKIVYQGIDISGNWKTKVEFSNGEKTEALSINQSAHSLKGTLVRHQDIDGITSISTSKVKGEVWEGCVTLKIRSTDSKKLSFGNMLLKVEGEKLVGYGSHRIVQEAIDSPLRYGDIINEQASFSRD